MDELADRIRAEIGGDPRIAEIRMFGGLCFTLNGNMQIAVRRDGGLLARVGPEQEEAALSRPGVERMVMRGRELPGYVTVPTGELGDGALREWLDMTATYVGRMPPKTKKKA